MALRIVLMMASILYVYVACSSERAVTVLMELQGGEEVLYIDGVAVGSESMYEELVNVIKAKGRDVEVMLIFNPAIRFAGVVNTRGILQAVGFVNVRVYYLGTENLKMAELRIANNSIMVPYVIKQLTSE